PQVDAATDDLRGCGGNHDREAKDGDQDWRKKLLSHSSAPFVWTEIWDARNLTLLPRQGNGLTGENQPAMMENVTFTWSKFKEVQDYLYNGALSSPGLLIQR